MRLGTSNRRSLRRNRLGQGFLAAIPVLVGIAIILYGLFFQSACVGNELIWIGAGVMVGGFGEAVIFANPYVALAGGAGVVLLLIGAVLRAFVLHC